MTEEKIIERIRKLLRLADEEGGGTEAERNLAMERAQKLMIQHQVEEYHLKEQTAEGRVKQESIVISGAMNMWQTGLWSTVGRPSFVSVIKVRTGKHEERLVLFGREDNISFTTILVKHLIPWLETECKDEVRNIKKTLAPGEKFNPRRFKRSFMQSATLKIQVRLADMYRGVERGQEMITNEHAANRREIQKTFPVVKKGRGRSSSDSRGHRAGYNAGGRADLTPGRKLGG